MFNDLLALFACFVFFFAFLFLFASSWLVSLIPTIRDLKRIQSELCTCALDKPISTGTRIVEWCSRLLADFMAAPPTDPVRMKHGDRSMGNVVGLLSYKKSNLNHITRELNTYAFLISMLGIIGFLKVMSHNHFEISFALFLSAASEDPFQLVALFELLVLLFFLFRLIVEIQAIRDLIDK
jgi:hypothetical protein